MLLIITVLNNILHKKIRFLHVFMFHNQSVGYNVICLFISHPINCAGFWMFWLTYWPENLIPYLGILLAIVGSVFLKLHIRVLYLHTCFIQLSICNSWNKWIQIMGKVYSDMHWNPPVPYFRTFYFIKTFFLSLPSLKLYIT